jgi:methionyl-tRNA formyltransferase
MRSILFFGSDLFSVRCFEAFQQSSKCPKARIDLVSVKDSEFSRVSAGISSILQVTSLKSFALTSQYDFCLVASFGHFIPPRLLANFKFSLNVHPSLLSKYRGPSPIQTAIIDRQSITGVSIINVHPTIIDGGDIYSQDKCDLLPNDDFGSLSQKLAEQGGRMLAKVVDNIEYYHERRWPQDNLAMTSTKMIHKRDGLVKFAEMTSEEIYGLFLGIGHQVHLYTIVNGIIVVFNNMKVASECPENYEPQKWLQESPILAPGTVFLERPTRSLWIRAKSGWLICSKFHLSHASPIPYNGGQLLSALQARSFNRVFD